jgi:hypothetical protein
MVLQTLARMACALQTLAKDLALFTPIVPLSLALLNQCAPITLAFTAIS